MIVRVYRNLHKKCWSVQEKKSRLILFHCNEIVLKNCKFIVNEAGRQRVLKEKRKNVHAFIEGTLAPISTVGRGYNERVIYNPYAGEYFKLEKDPHTPVGNSHLVMLADNGCVYADQPEGF